MDRRNKKIVKKALKKKKNDERFNEALSRVLSEKFKGKKGYSLYLDLIREIRTTAREEGVSIVEGAKMIVGENQ